MKIRGRESREVKKGTILGRKIAATSQKVRRITLDYLFLPLASWLPPGSEDSEIKVQANSLWKLHTELEKLVDARRIFHQDINHGCFKAAGFYGVFLSFVYLS